MKKFNIYDYPSSSLLAKDIERAVNNSSSPEKNLSKIKEIFSTEDEFLKFSIACLLYWAETERYDERNIVAVLISREIVKRYPALNRIPFSDHTLKNAFAFTLFAHRYLQNEFFKVVLIHLKQTGYMGIHQWYTEAEFVIDRVAEAAIPYSEYKRTHMI